MAIFFSLLPIPPSLFKIIDHTFALLYLQWVIYKLYRRVVHMFVATGEFSGQNVENSSFKRKGRLDNTHGFVKVNK